MYGEDYDDDAYDGLTHGEAEYEASEELRRLAADANTVDDHCPECNEYESECTCRREAEQVS